jgi:hypothetical protein
MKRTYPRILALVTLAVGSGAGWSLADAADRTLSSRSQAAGIAAQYPNDLGIAKHPAVVFADDFESWGGDGTEKPADKWHGIRQNKTGRTRAIGGNVTIAGSPGPGERVLEIACRHEEGSSQVGGLWLKLGNYNDANEGLGEGYDDLYVRYYIRFDENYRGVRNHGSNLGGRDVTVKNAGWVGMAGIQDVSTRGYFYSGVQPYAKEGSRELEMGFYSYHLDKKGPWGENYEVGKKILVKPGSWHCVERHMKLNSVDPTDPDPAQADGLEELWIDGELTIRKEGVRFRRVPQLHITFLSMETYYHGLPEEFDEANPIKVHFDNVVIGRKYIGPMRMENPQDGR